MDTLPIVVVLFAILIAIFMVGYDIYWIRRELEKIYKVLNKKDTTCH